MTLLPCARTSLALPLATTCNTRIPPVVPSQLPFLLIRKPSTGRSIGTTCLCCVGRTGSDRLLRLFTTKTISPNIMANGRPHCLCEVLQIILRYRRPRQTTRPRMAHTYQHMIDSQDDLISKVPHHASILSNLPAYTHPRTCYTRHPNSRSLTRSRLLKRPPPSSGQLTTWHPTIQRSMQQQGRSRTNTGERAKQRGGRRYHPKIQRRSMLQFLNLHQPPVVNAKSGSSMI